MAIMSCRIRLQSKIRKGKLNTQANVLSKFNIACETISHDDNDEIPVFHLEIFNVELERNKSPDEFGFNYVQYAKVDELFAAMEDPVPPATSF